MADESFVVSLRIDLEGDIAGQLGAELGRVNSQFQGFDTQIGGVQKKLDGTTGSTNKMSQSLSTARYALYDVSTTLAATGAALLGVSVGATMVAVAWERDFANVARTTGLVGDELAQMRADVVDLAQTLPTAFGDITEIATLGAQMGVANEDLVEFTETVIKFSAATGITAEQSATAFGRLGNILGVTAAEFDNLGSSIVKVGVSTVATEAEIVAVAQQIGPIARLAGASAEEVVGLSAAFASVKIPPELSRSVITKTFTDITRAVAQGGPKLEAFGRAIGTSGAQFAQSWQSDATGTFLRFLEGIPEDGVGAVRMLDELGLASQRNSPALQKLAQNTDLVRDALRQAGVGWAENAELNRQFAIISETTAARLQVLGNNFMAFLDAVGSANLGPLGDIIDLLSGFFGMLTDIASTDVGGTILGIIAILTALGGVLAVAAGGLALFGASSIAMSQGLQAIVALAPRASAAILGTSAAAKAASGGMGAAAAATGLLVKALKALSILGLALILPDVLGWGADVARAARGVDDSVSGMADRVKEEFGNVNSQLDNFGDFGASLNRAFAGADAGIARDIKELDEALAGMVKGGQADQARQIFDDLRRSWVDSGKDASLFRQYMTDTNNALKETVDTGAGAGAGLDPLNGALNNTQIEAEETAAALDALKQAILDFGSTSISLEESNIAFYEALNQMTEAAAAAGATLYGTDAASLALRDSFIGMDEAARNSAIAILENGGSVETATASYNSARQAIIDARVAKGEDAAAAAAWADAVLGTSAEAQGAIQAYADKINGVPTRTDTTLDNNALAASGNVAGYIKYLDSIPTSRTTVIRTVYTVEGAVGATNSAGQLAGPGYATGGAIYGPGTSTSDSIPILASNGEYMVRAAAVDRYGLAFMNAINKGTLPRFAGGGSVGGGTPAGGGVGTGIVELGPKSLARLGREVAVNVMLDDVSLSRTVQRGNEKRRAVGDI